MKVKSLKGFTLIELLVVVTIIGSLAIVILIAINPIGLLAKSRDSKRKSDLRQISNALQRYHAIHGVFPPARGCDYGQNCYAYSAETMPVPKWIPEIVDSKEMVTVPFDPKNITVGTRYGPWVDGNYTYAYGNVSEDGQDYDLVTKLEYSDDPDRCGLKNYHFANGITGWNKVASPNYITGSSHSNGPWCQAFGGAYSNLMFEISPHTNNN